MRGDGVQHAGLRTLIPWGRTPRIQTSATAGLGWGNAAVLELSRRQQHSTFWVQPSGQPSGEASPFSKATPVEAVRSHQGEVQRGRCPQQGEAAGPAPRMPGGHPTPGRAQRRTTPSRCCPLVGAVRPCAATSAGWGMLGGLRGVTRLGFSSLFFPNNPSSLGLRGGAAGPAAG